MSFAVSILIFCSGAAGLMYEVLWMKQLGLLFGNSAQASAATLAAFFLGLGAGSWWWGKRVARGGHALRTYAGLEAGVLGSALAYFVVLWVFHRIYPWLLALGGGTPWPLAAKFALALVLVCPGAFFMGGTLPVLGQFLVRRREEFGRAAARIYGINTLGAALGAWLAGMALPPAVGYSRSYLVALGLTASVAVLALRLARRAPRGDLPQLVDPGPEPAAGAGPAPLSRPLVAAACFVSGLGILALEVLWTHMFGHVYQSTVYTFAIILIVTLVCLAAGAGAAGLLARRAWSGAKVLTVVLTASAIWVCLTPGLFVALTRELQVVSSRAGWVGYNGRVVALTVAVAGVPLCLLGTVFPYLLKLSERHLTSAGHTLGRLGAINTAGTIVGSLAAGFVLLPWWGLWRSIHAVGLCYALLALLPAFAVKPLGRAWRATALGAGLLCAALLLRADLPAMFLAPGETMLKCWHGAHGTVAVVRQGDSLSIKIDGHYGLGSSAADELEKGQTRIPMMLHPRAKSIYFLGLGTGITAGEACSGPYKLERIVATELVPEVVEAARDYFGDYTRGLFADPRCRVAVDDGRHYLAASRETFDIVNSDLFVVYQKGAGNLYSLEHFRTVREHLAPDGIFVLWIPLYQLTKDEFGIIARTMLEVFPQVTAWRNQFPAWQDTLALVGQTDERSVFGDDHAAFGLEQRREAWQRHGWGLHESNLLLYYCGNLSRGRKLFKDYPLNTDDRPRIEYLTPVSASLQAADKALWLAGPKFVALLGELQACSPPEQDPALGGLPPEQRHAARAGCHLAKALLCEDYFKKTGETQPVWQQQARKARDEFRKLWLQPASR